MSLLALYNLVHAAACPSSFTPALQHVNLPRVLRPLPSSTSHTRSTVLVQNTVMGLFLFSIMAAAGLCSLAHADDQTSEAPAPAH